MSLVSAIIPTYFRNDRLLRAISSVQNQTYEDIEIIVVDDSGESHAESIIFDEDVHYISQEKNYGPNRARSVGADAASGDYIQFLDDDDQLKPDKIERQVNFFEQHPDVGVVCCGGEWSTGGGFEPDFPHRDHLRSALTFELFGCVTATMLIRSEVLKDVLPWPDSPGFDDPWLKTELAKRTNFGKINDRLVMIERGQDSRVHSEGEIKGMKRYLDQYSLLYDRLPQSVRRRAICRYHERRAAWLLEQRGWSFSAIIAYLKAMSVAPNGKSPRLAKAIGSLGGRPGVRVIEKCMKAITWSLDRLT